MQTNDLIKALKADAAKPPMAMGSVWWVAAAGATALAALAFFLMIGPRSDIAQAAHTLRFLFKFVATLTLAFLAFALLRAMSRPGRDIGPQTRWLALPAVLLGAAVIAELSVVPAQQWGMVWWGSNVYICLTFIPLIGLGPLAVFLAALRHGAPTRPTLAGAVAGLLAGALAATFYAAHCTDDSPLFVATWYSTAIAGLTLLGALLGNRLARW